MHRPVLIDKVLLSPYGIKIRGLRVMEPGDEHGRCLLTSEAVLVTVKLSALFSRRLELRDVPLVAPSIRIARGPAGR